MKKRFLLLIPAICTLLAGCSIQEVNKTVTQWTNEHILNKYLPGLKNTETLEFEEGVDLTGTNKKGMIGDFSLVAPVTNSICHDLPTFSWTEAENAISYTLEVCSVDTFDSTSNSVIYAKETNISSTSFKLSSTLKKKNIDYFWRVTAVNEFNNKTVGKEKVSEVNKFHYEVESSDEVIIGVGEKEDWALHEVGSYADISIDHNDFFGTGDEDSLVITFEKENTSQGPGHEKSDGWIVVQKAMDLDLFDLDAFYCNFYFMGHDSTILIRIIDQDGELWYKQVKFTMDTRQLALLKFDDFILRTGDTVVQNETFDHEHIQAMEVCFEKTFGDGCCIVGGIKAVSFETYKDLFITKLNFNLIDMSDWKDESYKFLKTVNPEDPYELKLEYKNEANFNGNEKAMANVGWGFAKIPLERYFSEGNAIRVKVKYENYAAKSNAIIRIYEPDKDLWSYVHPYSVLTAGEYQTLTIPFMAFGQSSIVEGKRQFYYISTLQLGLNNCYGSGALYYKDFEIITLDAYKDNPRIVEQDGMIENFDNYVYRGEAYQQWETSVDNKDEGIFLLNEEKFHNGSNVYAGSFTYKADMMMASYDIYTDVKAQGLNAIKFWIKDASVPNTNVSYFANYTGEDVSPTVIIQVVHKDGRWYRYTIDKAPRIWTEYTIPFSKFVLQPGTGVELDTSEPLISQNIINFAVGFQYYYKIKVNGQEVGYPLYTQNNPVYMDEIKFGSTSSSDAVVTPLENALHPDKDNVTLVDNFEYQDTIELNNNWFCTKGYDYENITLSDEVTPEGDSHSMKLDYVRGQNSPAYALYPTIGSDVEAKALQVDLKGDGVATIYINFYLYDNNTTHQYRATLANFSSSWNRVILGVGNSVFVPMDGGQALARKSLLKLQKITFGVAGGSGGATSSILVDNMKFVVNKTETEEYAYGTKLITPIAMQ